MLAAHVEFLFGASVASGTVSSGSGIVALVLADTTRLLHLVRMCTSSSLYRARSRTPRAAQRPLLLRESQGSMDGNFRRLVVLTHAGGAPAGRVSISAKSKKVPFFLVRCRAKTADLGLFSRGVFEFCLWWDE